MTTCSIESCERPVCKRGWCDPHYKRWWRHGDPFAGRARIVGTIAERLAARVDSTTTPDGCWPWMGSRNNKGYGQLQVKNPDGRKRPTLTHRLAWEVANGESIPDGLFVLHSCDNPPCCNPAHLSVGDASRNMLEMWERIRGPRLTRKAEMA